MDTKGVQLPYNVESALTLILVELKRIADSLEEISKK